VRIALVLPILLVIGVQDEQHVERPRHRRIRVQPRSAIRHSMFMKFQV
jgi:hypothetical protein